ncbi:unnamed protein product, partial [marine sediment metagenome]
DFPKDIQSAQTEFKYPKKVCLNSYKPTFSGNVKQIKAVPCIPNIPKDRE